MEVNKVSNQSFKSAYMIKGQGEVLDEICWYLHRKQIKSDSFEFLDIRNGIELPLDSNKGDHLDLFLTGKDKKAMEPKIRTMVGDSLPLIDSSFNSLPLSEKMKKLITHLSDADNSLLLGKAISTVKTTIVKPFLDKYIDKSGWNMNLNDAEAVFDKIRTGKFNIETGSYA